MSDTEAYPIWIGDSVFAALCTFADESRPIPRATPEPVTVTVKQRHDRPSYLAFLRDHPGATTAEIAAALGIARQTAKNRLSQLQFAGRVRSEAQGWKAPSRWWAT